MTTPPSFSASASASADLPLAVGPAIRTALGLLMISCWPDACMLYHDIIRERSYHASRRTAAKSRRIGHAGDPQADARGARSRPGCFRRPFDQGREARRRSQEAPALFARRIAGAVQALGSALA